MKEIHKTKVFVTKAKIILTRFNKIATQGAPQMAVDKEANSLSRVYSYYSKFNLRLFYNDGDQNVNRKSWRVKQPKGSVNSCTRRLVIEAT